MLHNLIISKLENSFLVWNINTVILIATIKTLPSFNSETLSLIGGVKQLPPIEWCTRCIILIAFNTIVNLNVVKLSNSLHFPSIISTNRRWLKKKKTFSHRYIKKLIRIMILLSNCYETLYTYKVNKF